MKDFIRKILKEHITSEEVDRKKIDYIKKHLSKLKENPSYNWIKDIDVEINEYQFGDELEDNKKVNSYILYSNTDNPPPFKLRLEIFDRILDTHMMLYPYENDEPTRGQEILVVNSKNQRTNLPSWNWQ